MRRGKSRGKEVGGGAAKDEVRGRYAGECIGIKGSEV